MTKLTSNKQIKQMYEEGKSTHKIADELGLSAMLVWRRLVKLGVPLRNQGAQKGHKHSDITKKKISYALTGNKNPRGMLGKHHSDETKIKMAESKRGNKNPQWKGNEASKCAGRIRAKLRYNCPKGKEIHHIDGNPLNNNPENIKFVTRKEHMVLDGRMEKLTNGERDEHGYFC